MDFSDIKQRVDVPTILQRYGIELTKGSCCCPIHGGDNKTAFSVAKDKQSWFCHTGCNEGGDVFTFVERMDGIGNAEAKQKVEEMFNLQDPIPVKKPKAPRPKMTPTDIIENIVYEYKNEDGDLAYTITRTKYKDGSKKFIPNYNGRHTLPEKARVLYNLDKVVGNMSDHIFICEGEKVADALGRCGYIGTCNAGGSNAWNERYVESLRDLSVIIMPDSDECGEGWRDKVLDSIVGVVKEARILPMPSEFTISNPELKGHDFADFLEMEGEEKAKELLSTCIYDGDVMPRGVNKSVLNQAYTGMCEVVAEMEQGVNHDVLDFGKLFPSFRDVVAREGDLVTLMASTGIGKTRLLHNIPYHVDNINYAMFDLELSYKMLCKRYLAMHNGWSLRALEHKAMSGYRLDIPKIEHVYIPKIRNLTVSKIERRVDEIEQATGKRMHVVAVDYIGLMNRGASSYEATSDNVEQFKSYVEQTRRVGVLTSQVGRPSGQGKDDGATTMPTRYDAKNSGSMENSSQILFGFCKSPDNWQQLHGKCLKYTHGEEPDSTVVLDANNLMITEAGTAQQPQRKLFG